MKSILYLHSWDLKKKKVVLFCNYNWNILIIWNVETDILWISEGQGHIQLVF